MRRKTPRVKFQLVKVETTRLVSLYIQFKIYNKYIVASIEIGLARSSDDFGVKDKQCDQVVIVDICYEMWQNIKCVRYEKYITQYEIYFEPLKEFKCCLINVCYNSKKIICYYHSDDVTFEY